MSRAPYPSPFEPATVSAESLVAVLRASGEPTRLRILALLAAGDLTVKDLTAILGQSQPRISRHLKLLTEAGLVDRFPEGSWVYYRPSVDATVATVVGALLCVLDSQDPAVVRDRERFDAVKAEHAARTEAYFSAHAAQWAELRSLHVAEDRVEAAIREAVGERRIEAMLDLGTGTGRMLTLLADRYERAVGIDASHGMLQIARAEIDRAGVAQARVQQGDVHALPGPRDAFDLVTIHQVLHYLDEPTRALREAARVLRPGGRLLIVDFAPHDLEFLREAHAHRRLGFSHGEITRALEQAGLELVSVTDLAASPRAGAPAAELTVTLWLARDRRVVLADTRTSEFA
ncbi:metalloregulator ArsR/SmtB family transcription factor [Siculibacillus lacustris]|uniref:Metalloregulator ArsR/SmtB family transcription factor n=1 Tax=Siculibacillus lacustris TaxID=1549641 RepID=A0A4Q9VS60_9HYPH|nr:metalloregulator ArsR/SmtB family transcription factor [Siculibacillus lacustris]TBW38782.1 metalloregulator ArsR/SmtB family transcription factor [Siculibacillus lacustris]